MSYRTRQEVAEKIDCEGGTAEAVAYGLTVDDMPPGDSELRAAWARLEEAHLPFEQAVDAVNDLLDGGA